MGQSWKPLSRTEMAARVARDIPEGWYVNLGIGMPTLVSDHIPAGKDVIIHSENGIVGMGPQPKPDAVNPWLVNAGKQYVTLVTGGAIVHHADSFGMIRGGHIDLCVLGAFQVAENGDLANWATLDDAMPPAVGGAMDLCAGAQRLWIMTDQTTKSGEPKLVERCTYPLTGLACVSRVYTNVAVFDVSVSGFELVEAVPGLGIDELQDMTGATIRGKG
ncbi:MAG: 3-oxoacid CoA-transferase subunit B [Rhizobiaceae bacterium]|nr:3-oxoacid CoA-transferase subunit B [Rhizobiaceae bacterium]